MNQLIKQRFVGQAIRSVALASVLACALGHVQAGALDPSSDPAFVNAYVGASYGFQARGDCQGADICERGGDAVKIFGGYRFTPSLATEVSYYYLGKSNRTWATGNSGRPTDSFVNSTNTLKSRGTVNYQSDDVQAIGVGVALESEMFPNAFNGRFIQHLRAGLALAHVKKEQTWDLSADAKSAGLDAKTTAYKNTFFPYVGAGLSYGITPRIRAFTSADVLIIPDRLSYVVTVGAGGEF
jgi:OmpA-like transmembrane domain